MRAALVSAAVLALAACSEAPAPAPAAVAPAGDAVQSAEQAFAAHVSDIAFYGREAAGIAREKSGNAEVRVLAGELEAEHRGLDDALNSAMAKANPPVSAPAAPGADKIALLDGLLTMPEASFDRAFIDRQISAEQDGVNTLRRYAEAGHDPALKAFATEALAGAERRLARVQDLRLTLLALQPPRV